MTPNLASNEIAFLGDNTSLYEISRTAMRQIGREIALVGTKRAINRLLETQAIKIMVVDLALKDEDALQIIGEIRKARPHLKILALTSYKYRGHSIQDILASNYHCMALGVDGTFTVEQFREAIRKLESQNFAHTKRIVIAIVCMAVIGYLATISGSPTGKFLGAFWVTALFMEFLYFLRISSRQRA